jgi:hypothetical protein
MFYTVLKLCKNNYKQLFPIFLFDLLFVIALYSTKIFFELLKPSSIFSVIIIQLIYLLLFIFIYSLFKYSILHFIANITGKNEFKFRRVVNFYYLNLILVIVSAAIFYIIELIYSFLIRPESGQIIALFIFVIYLVLLYVFVNISHSFFILGNGLKQTLKKSFVVVRMFKAYAGTLLIPVLIMFVYYLTYTLITFIVRFLIKNPSNSFLSNYFGFFMIVTGIISYIIILSNRLYFYQIVKKQLK